MQEITLLLGFMALVPSGVLSYASKVAPSYVYDVTITYIYLKEDPSAL